MDISMAGREPTSQQDVAPDIFHAPPPLAKVLFPAAESPRPSAVMFSDYCGQYLADVHARTYGPIPDLGVHRFTDCFIGTGGVLMSRAGKIFDAPDLLSDYWRSRLRVNLANRTMAPRLLQCLAGTLDPAGVETIEEEVVSLVRPGSGVYGHWLLDIMPMIWLHQTSEHRQLRYLVSSETPEWVFPILKRAFGLEADRFLRMDEKRGVVHCRNVIVPSLMRVSPWISADYNRFVAHVIDACRETGPRPANQPSEAHPKRVYISRRSVKNTAPIERLSQMTDAIEERATAHGLTIVSPERMPWDEQVRLFRDAELVMGEFGSGMHNTVFSGASAINVVLSNRVMTWTQSAIAGIRGQRMQYIRPSGEFRDGNTLQSEYDIDAIGSCLDQVLATLA